jgi:hypothetical protein
MELLANQVKLPKGLETHYLREILRDEVVNRVKIIPRYEAFKGSVSMVRMIAEAIENLTEPDNKTKRKLDKKALCLDCLRDLFPAATELEIAQWGRHIDYLCDKSGSILRIGFWKRMWSRLKNVLCLGSVPVLQLPEEVHA